MGSIIYQCKTRATDKEGDVLRASINWAFARRAKLRLTDRAIEFRDWTIPYEEIDDAVLLMIPSAFGPSCVLRVKSRGKTHHFQLYSISYWWNILDPFWLGDTPLHLRIEKAHIDPKALMLVIFGAFATLTLIQIMLKAWNY